jgi:putative transcriptional regulator
MQYIIAIMPYISYISFMAENRVLNRLKLARVESGLTQVQLADRVDVTRQTIGLIEAGGYNPTLNLCLRLAEVTGKTLDELFWPLGEE